MKLTDYHKQLLHYIGNGALTGYRSAPCTSIYWTCKTPNGRKVVKNVTIANLDKNGYIKINMKDEHRYSVILTIKGMGEIE